MNTFQFLPHLIELRKRLIRCSLLLILLFFCFFSIDETLYSFFAIPLLQHLPAGSSLIATEIITPFTIPMKLAFIITMLLAIPYIFYELWSFIAPALYKSEKKALLPVLIASIVLFYLGALFSYFVLCPMAFNFFIAATPKGVAMMTDIKHYLDFVLTMLWAGGIAFQVPILTIVCMTTGIVSREQLKHMRPYVIVAAFVLGMLLTPPDVVSQIMLALPMWGLFEIGLWIGSFYQSQRSLRVPE